MSAIAIPAELLAQLYRHACAAFPAECCGYLIGPRAVDGVDAVIACTNVQAAGEHPTHPDRTAETGFVIAGTELFELARSLAGSRPVRIIYHSHTNGRAYFSAIDHALASVDATPVYPVQHLVIGVLAAGVTEAVQLGWSAVARQYVELARWSAA